VHKLWRVIKSRLAQELNADEYQRAFWMKVTQPFIALVMVFLAVPFAFGPLRSSSMGLKILVGVLFGFSFHTLNSIFGPLTAVTGLSPMLAAFIPLMLFFMFGTWMVLRVR
jgi:lipopolysaccharide export system permease protein